jgi:HEAT repeat protein
MPLIRKPTGTPPPTAPSGGLGSASPDERWSAVRRLTAAADLDVLAAALQVETDPRVREAIFTSLARIGGPGAARAVARHIRSDDAGLRAGALDTLRGMPDVIIDVLPALLTDRDSDVRLLACELVRGAPGSGPARLVCELLEHEQEVNVAAAAVEVLSEVGGLEALPVLDRCAERFSAEPFMGFSIRIARERIGAQR